MGPTVNKSVIELGSVTDKATAKLRLYLNVVDEETSPALPLNAKIRPLVHAENPTF